MIPETDQQVRCYMRSGIVLEGIVIEWSSEVVLKSLDGENLIIIHRPADDIMLTKIVLTIEKPAENIKSEKKELIKEKLQELQTIDDPELRNKTVAELRDMVVAQDRQMIANKTREHFGNIGTPKTSKYSSPFMPKGK